MTFLTSEGSSHFIGSSGGNAGMAMAVAAKKMGKEWELSILLTGFDVFFLSFELAFTRTIIFELRLKES